MFYSRTKKPEQRPTNAGRKEKNTYSIKMDDRGHKSVVCTGATDTYAKIQEAAEDCKVENIIKRFKDGNTLNDPKYNPVFADITNMPKTLAEAHTLITNIEESFANLPLDVRRMYDHSSAKFVADYGSERWKEIFTPKPSTITEIITPTPEVKTNETE